ncbi:hypothetical protein JOL62DRAFT_577476 [Phyllosticta paracitricarpa]|uniref:Secreted protein n=1 Tax=Phyllosticta paracitricarpa TaxID=2016321 RepID=A0ABR1N3E2_9PEZI
MTLLGVASPTCILGLRVAFAYPLPPAPPGVMDDGETSVAALLLRSPLVRTSRSVPPCVEGRYCVFSARLDDALLSGLPTFRVPLMF